MSSSMMTSMPVTARQTFQGIDTCGQRLADEIARIASQHASLQYFSCIGHSMGGLLARYAIGEQPIAIIVTTDIFRLMTLVICSLYAETACQAGGWCHLWGMPTCCLTYL